MQTPNEHPTTIVIFGATGDLSQQKLIPALFDLYKKKLLPKTFRIVGFSRRPMTNDEFRVFVRKVIEKKKQRNSKRDLEDFLQNIFYSQGLFEKARSYQSLAESIIALDEEFGKCSNSVTFLAKVTLIKKVTLIAHYSVANV